MNLYLVSQSENKGYDTYDSFVCRAVDEEAARNMHPSNGEFIDWSRTKHYWYDWASCVEAVKVELLAENVRGEQGVVCASFNAG